MTESNLLSDPPLNGALPFKARPSHRRARTKLYLTACLVAAVVVSLGTGRVIWANDTTTTPSPGQRNSSSSNNKAGNLVQATETIVIKTPPSKQHHQHANNKASTQQLKQQKKKQQRSTTPDNFFYGTEYNNIGKEDYELYFQANQTTNEYYYMNLLRQYHTSDAWWQETNGSINKNKNNRKQQPLRLVHVWSPYVAGSNDPTFAPLNQAQNVTWESMYQAWQFANHSQQQQQGDNDPIFQMEIYCAILWMDVKILQAVEPPLCRPDNTIVLKRSTVTLYTELQPKIHYPIVQDILDPLLVANNNDNDSWDYIILTNSDIALVQPFYLLVALSIYKYGFEMYTVHRRTISKAGNNINDDNDSPQPWTSNHLGYLQETEMNTFREHTGTDCFIMHADLISSIHLGNLFVGHPPWARVLKHVLYNHMAVTYHTFVSNYGWTFHLGDDRPWAKPSKEQKIDSTLKSLAQQATKDCVFSTSSRHTTWHLLQNTLNCAALCQDYASSITTILRQKQEHAKDDEDSSGNKLNVSSLSVPSFVVDKERFVQGIQARQVQGRVPMAYKRISRNPNN